MHQFSLCAPGSCLSALLPTFENVDVKAHLLQEGPNWLYRCNNFVLLLLNNKTTFLFLPPICAQMQSWLGTFNPERERRKVMGCQNIIFQHTYTFTPSYTQSMMICACAGLTLVVMLGTCQTTGSYLTWWHLLLSPQCLCVLLALLEANPYEIKSYSPKEKFPQFNTGTKTSVQLCICALYMLELRVSCQTDLDVLLCHLIPLLNKL